MSEEQVEYCLDTSTEIKRVCFEGGEPFLRFPTLLRCLEAASARELEAGVVTNGFWATDAERALSLLGRLQQAGLCRLMVSTGEFHGGEQEADHARMALDAARQLGIDSVMAETSLDQVMFRGRAAESLAHTVTGKPPETFDCCPFERLAAPDRVHIDAWGHVHLCQGLTMGRVSDDTPLDAVFDRYVPEDHPIVAPLLEGGPIRLAQAHGLELQETYADACHLCYRAREAVRDLFPEVLAPGPMYGISEERGG